MELAASIKDNTCQKTATVQKNNENTTFFKPFVQPKLTINQPGDIYEQEADTVAERVMRTPEPHSTFFQPIPLTSVQRKCAACEQEEKVHRKEDEEQEDSSIQLKPAEDFVIQRKCAHCEEEEKLQMKGESGASSQLTATAAVHDVINSGGQALDAGTKGFMESRFGYDFGKVRIHNDSLAHQSSEEINALAYTHGNHVVFGSGKYQPDTNSGKQLLAHELTHVIQQQNARIIQRNKKPVKVTTDPMSEIEKQLSRRFVDPDDPQLAVRRKILNDLFLSLDPAIGEKLLKRLKKPVKGDTLSQNFQHLATPTRHELILILRENVELKALDSAMGPKNYCKPFTKEEIENGVDFNITNRIDHLINEEFRDHYGNEVAEILNAYQERRKGDSLTHRLYNKPGSEIVNGFIYDPVTFNRQEEIIDAIEKYLYINCPALPENKWTSFDLQNMLAENELNKIFSFTDSDAIIPIPTIPGLLAGGVGSSDAGPDSRSVSGKFELLRSVSKGKINIRIRTMFHFQVIDAFNFCPGNMGGPIAQIITVPLSRMEASNLAYDVPIKIEYDGPKIEKELDFFIGSKCFTK